MAARNLYKEQLVAATGHIYLSRANLFYLYFPVLYNFRSSVEVILSKRFEPSILGFVIVILQFNYISTLVSSLIYMQFTLLAIYFICISVISSLK